MAEDKPQYGERPLPQTIAFAGAVRRLTGLVLSLEHSHPAVDAMLAQFGRWENELAAAVPPDSAPRVGPDADDTKRVYLDHAFDVGAYNPCYPEYEFDRLDAETASGRVNFPLVFEGPPGFVNGDSSRSSSIASPSTRTARRACRARRVGWASRSGAPPRSSPTYGSTSSGHRSSGVSGRRHGCSAATKCSASASSIRWPPVPRP